MNYIELTEKIRLFTEGHVKKSRYEHSVRVAQMCARICRYYGLDADKGYLAGIGHDMCKDFPDDKLIELASKDGNPIIEIERQKPSLLHGRAASVMMKESFLIDDEDILIILQRYLSAIVKRFLTAATSSTGVIRAIQFTAGHFPLQLQGTQGKSAQRAQSRAFTGPQTNGDIGPYTTTDGQCTACAICAGPVSVATSRTAPCRNAANSGKVSLPARTCEAGIAQAAAISCKAAF